MSGGNLLGTCFQSTKVREVKEHKNTFVSNEITPGDLSDGKCKAAVLVDLDTDCKDYYKFCEADENSVYESKARFGKDK